MAIADNLACVRERMKQAALRCNRQPDEIRLVAVSKTVSAEVIREALNAGAMILGENYIQEAREKIALIGAEAEWHFIGHLQSNKAKSAVDLFSLIHSVDRMTLAEELNKEAGKRNKILPVLIQVNISGEETKSGIDAAGTRQLVQQVALLPSLVCSGAHDHAAVV